jgi:hypothetical protein
MSGYAGEALPDGVVALGATAFLQKPFTPDGLAGKIHEMLETPP